MLWVQRTAGLLFAALAVAQHQDSKGQHVFSKPGSDPTIKEDLSHIINKSPLLSLHRGLVEIESISNSEHDVGEFLVNLFNAHNFSVTTQDVAPRDSSQSVKQRWNIYATPEASKYEAYTGKQATPKVVLTSHIDTVPPFIPYSLSRPSHNSKRKDVRISGRGTVDAKACVAAMTMAVFELLEDPKQDLKPSDVALLFVVGEENKGDGMAGFSESKLYQDVKGDFKAIIFGEPTEGKLASGHKGISMLQIVAKGKAAHSGYPWLGRSANSMILPTLNVLDKLGDVKEEDGGLPRSKRYGNSTVNVGYMNGGVAGNVVPEHAEAKVSFRLAGGTPNEIKKTIFNAIKGTDPEGLLDVEMTQLYAPIPLDTNVEGFDSLVVNYGTDVPNLKVDEGVKRYLYGPGSILVAHGANEGLTIGDLEQAVVDYKKLILHALKL